MVVADVFENILSRLDEQGREVKGEGWLDEVSEALISLRADYDELTNEDREQIDYSNLATQAAYVYAYALSRAEFTYQLLKRHRRALGEPIFRSKSPTVTSLGGGPGSEIAGVVKYLLDEENEENVEKITYWVFDRNPEWSAVCSLLANEVAEYLPVELEYRQLDLTVDGASDQVPLGGDDLLILSFLISELCVLEPRKVILENLRRIYKTLDSGAFIFYNDSNASTFYYFFNESRKFVTGIGKRESEKSEVQDEITFAADLGETYGEYGDEFGSTPHMTSNALSKLIQRP